MVSSQFYDPKDARKDALFECTLLWSYKILPAPASPPVQPLKYAPSDSVLDDKLPPLDLEVPSKCNCILFPNNPLCLLAFSTHRDSDENGASLNVSDELEELELLQLGDEDDDECCEENDDDCGKSSSEEESEVLSFAEQFQVVGSFFEQRYQQALAICSYLKSNNKELCL